MLLYPQQQFVKYKLVVVKQVHKISIRRIVITFDAIPIQAQEYICSKKGYPFVAIEERMIVCKAFHQSGSFFENIPVVARSRSHCRSFESTLISQAMNTTKCIDHVFVNQENIGDGQIFLQRASNSPRRRFFFKLSFKSAMTSAEGVATVFSFSDSSGIRRSNGKPLYSSIKL